MPPLGVRLVLARDPAKLVGGAAATGKCSAGCGDGIIGIRAKHHVIATVLGHHRPCAPAVTHLSGK